MSLLPMKSIDEEHSQCGNEETLDNASRSSVASFTQHSPIHRFYRPFVMPVYDPQHTNEDIPRVYQSPSLNGSRPDFPYPGEDNFAAKMRAHFGWYESANDSTRNLLNRRQSKRRSLVSNRLSQVSITPSEIPLPDLARHSMKDTPVQLDELSPMPEEDRMSWLHALAGFLVILNAQGLNMSFGIFQAYYEKVLLVETPSSKIAWIGSVQIFFVFSMSLLVAPAVNKGHFRLCFNGGSLLLLLGIFATSFCTSWWQLFLIQGLITGIGMGSVFTSGLMVLLTYFTKHLGSATGIAAAGAPVGGIFFPLVARSAIDHVGYAWTVRIFALVNLVTMSIANLIVRPKPTKPKSPVVEAHDEQKRPLDKSFILMTAGMFSTFWGFFVAYYYIVLYGQDVLHMDDTTAVNLLIAMNASNLAGRFLPNLISDTCLGPLNTITPWTLGASMLAFCWVAAANNTGLFLISCLYGFTSSAIQSLYTSTIFGFTGRGSASAAKCMGMVLAAIGLAVLTGAPIGGALIARSNGNYLHTQVFAGSTLGVGGLLFLAARLTKSGWSPDKI